MPVWLIDPSATSNLGKTIEKWPSHIQADRQIDFPAALPYFDHPGTLTKVKPGCFSRFHPQESKSLPAAPTAAR
jgi:hypothetical protein